MSYLLFFSFLGLAFFVYREFRKRMNYRSNKREIDDVVIQLLSNNHSIHYTEEDKVRYFGSLVNDEEIYSTFKQDLPMTDKALLRYFGDGEYNTEGDNLLIYKLVKDKIFQTYIIVVNDPADMEQHFTIREILGPYDV